MELKGQTMELNPCPFCGGAARVYCRDGVRVKCTKCGCETPVRSDNPEQWENGGLTALNTVIREWNRRAG